MLIHDEDADELDSPVSPSQPDTSLKGMVGGRRRSEDADATLVAKNLGTRSPFGRHEAEDWMMHPRTAAIRGTSHRVQNDAVAVPEKLPRPRSLGDEFITISLESPPHSSTTASESGNGATLSRTGSLDSSFHRLKKGASVFLMNIGSMSGPSDKSHIESRRVNGHSRETNTEQDDESSHRSSSTTFGIHRSLSSPPPALFTSFSSLRNLISTAAALGRSSTASGNEPSPPLSPSTCLRRSQTVSFGEHHDLSFGRVPSGQLSFSPASRRIYTPSMIPTIVIPQHSPDERSMPMAAMASYTPDSASSSVTMFSSNDGLGHKGHRYTSMDGQHGLLRVPEPARTVIRGQTSSAAMAAMSATSISRSRDDDTLNRSPTSISADSLAGPLMSDDYIGQFERERALARTKGTFATTSAMSLATTVHHSANQWATIKSVDFIEPSRNDNGVSDTEHTRTMSTGARKSRTCPLFKVVRGSRHGRSLSGQSDISEKLMQLPEPSRFEGMCSGRGFINITSMVLIMCGLVLLVLGYPIAASMRRDRLAEAAASATANNGTATGIHQVKFTMANSTTFSGGILSQEKTTTTRNVDVEHV
ncbi:hypothetical protein B0O80DRAFT_455264 [Mortierella sp. GBAus27b]|nr:hypothetical protein B0O80DRAFT_455264 [Mortierella sp. GBAus27b]